MTLRICPICEEPATHWCRCPRSNTKCKNGHTWHYCTAHTPPKIVIGEHDHSKPLKFSTCTCVKKPTIITEWLGEILELYEYDKLPIDILIDALTKIEEEYKDRYIDQKIYLHFDGEERELSFSGNREETKEDRRKKKDSEKRYKQSQINNAITKLKSELFNMTPEEAKKILKQLEKP